MAIDYQNVAYRFFLFRPPSLKTRSPFEICQARPRHDRARDASFSRNTAPSAKGYRAFDEQQQARIRLILGFWSRRKCVYEISCFLERILLSLPADTPTAHRYVQCSPTTALFPLLTFGVWTGSIYSLCAKCMWCSLLPLMLPAHLF